MITDTNLHTEIWIHLLEGEGEAPTITTGGGGDDGDGDDNPGTLIFTGTGGALTLTPGTFTFMNSGGDGVAYLPADIRYGVKAITRFVGDHNIPERWRFVVVTPDNRVYWSTHSTFAEMGGGIGDYKAWVEVTPFGITPDQVLRDGDNGVFVLFSDEEQKLAYAWQDSTESFLVVDAAAKFKSVYTGFDWGSAVSDPNGACIITLDRESPTNIWTQKFQTGHPGTCNIPDDQLIFVNLGDSNGRFWNRASWGDEFLSAQCLACRDGDTALLVVDLNTGPDSNGITEIPCPDADWKDVTQYRFEVAVMVGFDSDGAGVMAISSARNSASGYFEIFTSVDPPEGFEFGPEPRVHILFTGLYLDDGGASFTLILVGSKAGSENDIAACQLFEDEDGAYYFGPWTVFTTPQPSSTNRWVAIDSSCENENSGIAPWGIVIVGTDVNGGNTSFLTAASTISGSSALTEDMFHLRTLAQKPFAI